jgi:hypothetical protein
LEHVRQQQTGTVDPQQPVQENMLLNTTPNLLSEMDVNHWNLQQTPLKTTLNQTEGQLRDMIYEVGPEPAFTMAQIVFAINGDLR